MSQHIDGDFLDCELDESEENSFAHSDAYRVYDEDMPDATPLPTEVTDEVVRFYSPMVYRIALTKTRSTHDAEDIFSEVFLRLVSSKKKFESEEHRKAWLIRVTINCCNSHFVAPWRKNVDSMDDYTLSQIPDEDSFFERDDTRDDVYEKLLKLPNNMREVIILFYYENMSIAEISQLLGDTEASVKKRLSRARQRLKLELE